MMCSGGKDSLACLNLMNQAKVKIDVLTYSSNIYGSHQEQYEKAGNVLKGYPPENIRN